MLDFELYGGKRGLLEHARARILYGLGVYGRSRDIGWAAVGRLVFVCTGNICRSPYARARARLLGVPAVSFGLAAADGAPADPVASRNALLRGVDLSEHRSAALRSSSLTRGDLVVAFEPHHLTEIWRRHGDDTPASLLGVWTLPVRPHIQDPYGRSDRYFQQCFSVIDSGVAALVRKMVRQGTAELGEEMGTSGLGGPNKGSHDRTRV